MVDVDFFKKFNDTFGHETGDDVLRKVARQLERVGGGGTAFRFGGEEFAIVFRDTTLEESKYSAEELRQAIEEDLFVVRGPSRSARKRPERRASTKRSKNPKAVKTGVTVSIGVADTNSVGHLHVTDPQEVIAAADKALYRAKDLGRNRVECAGSRQSKAIEPSAKNIPAPQ
jgi:PleD family two-component response regulator